MDLIAAWDKLIKDRDFGGCDYEYNDGQGYMSRGPINKIGVGILVEGQPLS